MYNGGSMKKSELKLMIRQIVREEVAMSIQEVITELKQPTHPVSQPKPKRKVVEQKKQQFTKNSILNDVLNETAMDDEWKTMGGGTYDSNRMGEVLQSSYGNMMKSDGTPNITGTTKGHSGAPAPVELEKALNRDYSGLMKAINKKKSA